jgi:hypothetical protein
MPSTYIRIPLHTKRTWLEANFAIQAAKTNLSGTSRAITSSVETAMSAAAGTAKDDLLLVDSVIV